MRPRFCAGKGDWWDGDGFDGTSARELLWRFERPDTEADAEAASEDEGREEFLRIDTGAGVVFSANHWRNKLMAIQSK